MNKQPKIVTWAVAMILAVVFMVPVPTLAQDGYGGADPGEKETSSGTAPDNMIEARRRKRKPKADASAAQAPAASKYPNATRAEPKVSLTADGQKKVNAAYDLIDKEQFAEAEKQLNALVEGKRSTPYERALALQGLSSAAWEQERTSEALDFAQRAIATNALPNDAHFSGLLQLAQMNVADEKYQPALTLIDQWLSETRSERADAYALRGNALYRLERYKEAAVALQKAISLADKPNESWTQMLLGTYYEQEDYAGAATIAEGMLAKDPDNEKLIAQLASAYAEGEQNDKALALLEGAYQRGVLKSADQIKQLYQLYNYLEKPQQAAEVIKDGIAKGVLKEDLETTKALAYAYVTAEQFEPAAAAYAKAAQFTQDGEMDYQRGFLLLQELDKVPEGKAALEAAIGKGIAKPGNAYILIGNAELELGNKTAARAAYEKARGFPESKSMAETWLKGNK